MTVAMGDVHASLINQPHKNGKLARYNAEACHTLLRWVWSRTPENIQWTNMATERCFKLAQEMGTRYTQDPPLVQAANVRIKISRIATAIALRTFSSDDGVRCQVRAAHVDAAVEFMDLLYGMPGFGYKHRSQRVLADQKWASEAMDSAADMLLNSPKVTRFLQDCGGKFKTIDLREVMDDDEYRANKLISQLTEMRLLTRKEGLHHVSNELLAVLRKVAK